MTSQQNAALWRIYKRSPIVLHIATARSLLRRGLIQMQGTKAALTDAGRVFIQQRESQV